ncbi:hypothetical protein JOB18_026013 [Solea senegalensis]|nr:hypothetical protein JOB18_026013 [Solea senegalensis]
MDTRSKYVKQECSLRKIVNPGAKLRWRVLCSTEAGKVCQTAVERATIRNYYHREQKRAKKVAKIKGNVNKKSKSGEGSPAPRGAMAPENTTQYLMSNVYDDMTATDAESEFLASNDNCARVYTDSMSPTSVYSALDSGFNESCLAFQQRDFDEMFDLCW